MAQAPRSHRDTGPGALQLRCGPASIQQFGQLQLTPFCPEKSEQVAYGGVQTLGPMQAHVKFEPHTFGTSTQWFSTPSCVWWLAHTRSPVQSAHAFTFAHSPAGTQLPCQQVPLAAISGTSPGLQEGVAALQVTFDESHENPVTQRPATHEAFVGAPSSLHLS